MICATRNASARSFRIRRQSTTTFTRAMTSSIKPTIALDCGFWPAMESQAARSTSAPISIPFPVQTAHNSPAPGAATSNLRVVTWWLAILNRVCLSCDRIPERLPLTPMTMPRQRARLAHRLAAAEAVTAAVAVVPSVAVPADRRGLLGLTTRYPIRFLGREVALRHHRHPRCRPRRCRRRHLPGQRTGRPLQRRRR